MSQAVNSVELLEQQAAQQRRRMQDSVAQLRSRVNEKLDVNNVVRSHYLPIAAFLAVAGLSLGYSFGSIFRRG